MKLLKNKVLFFQEGNSDKVYEVDLCEVEGDLFVVNFRYGRRGSELKEGTKTVFPVSIEEAEKVFDKLVLSKEKKGYHEAGQAPVAAPATPKGNENTGAESTILNYLQDAVNGTYTRSWKVSRIIWRAGDLRIQKASENIASFLSSTDEFEPYAAVHALAKLNNSKHLDKVFALFNEKGFQDKLGRAAVAYILKLSEKNSAHQQEIFRRAYFELPELIRQSLEQKTAGYAALAKHFMAEPKWPSMTLYYLYLLTRQDESLAEPLKEIINRIPLKANTFQSIRYIFRTTEMLEDADYYTLMAKRIAVSSFTFSGKYLYIDNKWGTARDELKKKNSKLAFSKGTKEYFNRTSYRHIYQLGQLDQDTFIEYAKELLCNLDDQLDNAQQEIQSNYTYDSVARRYNQELRIFPKYANFPALMYVLHGGSSRLFKGKNRWYYEGTVVTPEAQVREEIFHSLWNRKPKEVLHILANSKAAVATSFALRIVKDNPAFLDQIPDGLIEKLLTHSDVRVVDLVMELLEKKYANSQPTAQLLLQVLAAKSERASLLGMKWLSKYEASYFEENDFQARLILTGNMAVVDYLKRINDIRLAYSATIQIETITPFFGANNEYAIDYLMAVNELIGRTHFGEILKNISVEKIHQLSTSQVTTDKLFAANLSRANMLPTYEIIKEQIEGYLSSDELLLRKVGVELLADFPDKYLIERHQLIGEYCFSPHEEVREAIQPTVGRLINLDAGFKAGLLKKLLTILTEAEEYPGVHESSYGLLKQYYGENLEQLKQEDIINLCLSKYAFAQKLGHQLFRARLNMADLDMPTLVGLADSDPKVLREDLQNYLQANPDRVNYEFFEALKILNTSWEDTQKWAFSFFENSIKTENWTLDTLLYVCDHTAFPVQSFGRRMVTKHFKKDEGLQLLLKLQEHPAKPMQFFATNYLETYAKDDPQVILQLELFFKTTLFNINENRAAKTRVFHFLEQEAVKDVGVAEMTIRILQSILSTNTMIDKSSCIDILLALKEKFPHLEVPLTIKSAVTHEV